MRVRAKHWLNIDGTWHRSGEEFLLSAEAAEQLRGSVELLDAVSPVRKEAAQAEVKPEAPAEAAPKKRSRSKKAAAE